MQSRPSAHVRETHDSPIPASEPELVGDVVGDVGGTVGDVGDTVGDVGGTVSDVGPMEGDFVGVVVGRLVLVGGPVGAPQESCRFAQHPICVCWQFVVQ